LIYHLQNVNANVIIGLIVFLLSWMSV